MFIGICTYNLNFKLIYFNKGVYVPLKFISYFSEFLLTHKFSAVIALK